ncbi:ligand-binding sensor domain-containing protein/DNA-binding CsgD family transcriptional regulator [Flavobacterium sp. CG_23.5]|uniref:helix-turn-helix and ligand-binding sensor domain-containing protein n=1 Tax=Flavobacterium sp. CG_23.5 TaxID=2760708 RepID=UPI001EC33F03|nr:triple tyrosine motif-containing protein [Flavobacterium sp. CG_23.5]MBP2284567.1 ligand-binding sensor domain-containing protein/DNA-binding CsgD family transcriptional regulator [Flavobacterium sp. CG_23.5]
MKTKLYIFLFLMSFNAFSQELPPIVKYASSIYGAGNQNWMISQDQNHYVYFANNEGLLEFNGSNWELYPSPNETIVRSVKVIGSKIFTGCYMEFGFWTRQANGKLKYTSLSKTIKNKILDDEQFWNILNYDQWVIFQSLNRIYIYDTKTGGFKIIAPKNNITKSFRTKNSIYFQTIKEGLFEIESGKGRLVSSNPILQNNRIVNVFAIDEGLLIQTQLNGFYKLIGNAVTKFSTEVDSELAASSVYSSQLLSDGSFALGTVSNGIFILNNNGKIKYHISQNKGLSNNTALSLYEDADRNLWVGLDNGINCINLQSPIQSFVDDTGILGTVYTSKLHNGNLYVGTNQGLFYKNYQTNDEFKFINGTKGQVWSLFEYDGTLFCGHDSGTFAIDNAVAKNIFSGSGTWKFETVPNQKELLLQGNYYGISVLEKVNNQWVFRNKIAGFNYSARYFEITNALEVYVSHEYKGVFRLQLDNKLQKTNGFTTYVTPQKGKNASLTKFNNAIYYAYKEGIFKLNTKTKQFEKDKLLSSVFEKDEYTSGKLIVDNSNKIWLFSKNYIYYFSLSKLSNQLKQNVIPIPASLTNSMLGFENISQISNSDYLIGTTDGYYTMNINDLSFKNYNVSISTIATNKLNENLINRSIQESGSFKYDDNNITFSYTVPEYNKYINADYQFLLEGFQDDWSEWNAKNSISFKNLPPGDYTFKVRAKFANSIVDNAVVYTFRVEKPWYLTNLALFVYFIFIIVMAQFIHKTYRNYYQKQKEKLIEENNLLLEIKELENEQELMRIRNEQLSQDVDTKNRELAVSTMSLNSKNELLAFIKDDLKKTTDDGNRSIKSVISTINKNITEGDSWNVFKEAFDNADKDFLKKMKLAHPLLTPNDLRLCAYLRLNLSSKEVAPLLNISVRSVEIKRYRLRKKMELSHEQGLVEYILAV